MTFLEAVKLSAETGCEVRPVGTQEQWRVDTDGSVWKVDFCPIFGLKWCPAELGRAACVLGPWERVEGA